MWLRQLAAAIVLVPLVLLLAWQFFRGSGNGPEFGPADALRPSEDGEIMPLALPPAPERRSREDRHPLPGTPDDRAKVPRVRCIRVIDLDGQAIANATVYWHPRGQEPRSEPDWSTLGRTEAGVDSLCAPLPARDFWLLARAEGYQASEVFVGRSGVEEIEMRLSPEATLSGIVVDTRGGPLAGMCVLAWPKGRYLDRRAGARALRGDPSLHVTRTGEDGGFLLGGLTEGTAYEAVAAGGGRFAAAAIEAHPGEDVTIRALPAYAATVRITRSDGDLVASFDYLDGRGPSFEVPATRVNVPIDTPVRSLGGIPPGLTNTRSRNPFFLFYCCEEESEEFGPIRILLEVPGFSPVRKEFWLPRLTTGIPSIDVSIGNPQTDLGELRIEWTCSGQDEERPATANTGLGRISFTSLPDHTHAFSLGIWDLEAKGRVFPGLPSGSYNARFYPFFGERTIPPLGTPAIPVLIQKGSVARLSLDAEAFGSVEFCLFDENGAPYDRRAIFKLVNTATQEERFCEFQHSPYLLRLVESGPYRATPLQLGFAQGFDAMDVFVAPGAKTEVRFRPR